ncbi:ABC transporter substrate-binding protein [Roseomonas sp. AR75]|uniref:ABC transporter substrate-binding protein n=1 Tax=Roseomonas sp. AR75 TaxID=2562311 RepID=UPI0014856744|nr:ABC transporter substrate-binding protein [Roseomonas sp. AR75]
MLAGLAATAGFAASGIAPARGATPIEVTDIAGRSVTLRAPARKIILGEGRLMYGFSTLVPRAPFERIVGWAEDMVLYDPATWRKLKAGFPQAERIRRFSSAVNADFSTEQAIALDPDLVLFPLSAYQRIEATGTIGKLARAGIPTAIVDFREQASHTTAPSIEVLGRLLGLENEARAFNDFYLRETRRVSSRVWNLPPARRTTVFMERAAGIDPNNCCMTFGNANLGVMLQDAGGINWGAARFPGLGGTVNPEAIFTDDPEVIIGTGADWSESTPGSRGVPFGYEATPERVQAALRALAERPGWPQLKAVRNKRFYSIYHQFYTSPAHLVAMQVFAKWLYPASFADLDPDATWRAYHERFSPIPLSGVFWAQLA